MILNKNYIFWIFVSFTRSRFKCYVIKSWPFLCLASVEIYLYSWFYTNKQYLFICNWLGKSFMQGLLRGRDKCSPHSMSPSYPLQVFFLLPPFSKTSPVLLCLIPNIINCPYFWCSNCSERCKKCPICRIIIEERLPVYDV